MNTEPVLLPHSLKRWERTSKHLANEIHLLFNSWKEIIRKWDQNRHNEHTARNILWFAFLLVRWIIARYFRNEFRDCSLASVSFNQAECFKLWIVKVHKLKYSRALLLSVAFQIYTGEISQRLTVLWVCVCEMYSEAMTPGATGGKNYEWQSPFYDMKRRASSQNIKWNQNQLH